MLAFLVFYDVMIPGVSSFCYPLCVVCVHVLTC